MDPEISPSGEGIADGIARDSPAQAALMRVAVAAAGASDLDDVIELAAEEARGAIDAASLSVSRYDHSRRQIDTLINVGELGPGEVRQPDSESFSMTEFPQVRALIDNRQSYSNDLADPDCDASAAALLRGLGKASDLGVAIVVENEVWGEVWASRRLGEPPFNTRDTVFLEAVAGQFAVAIARAELFSRVSRLAYEDVLTGLPNRRAYDERLQRAFDRDQRVPISLLICDLDGLKEINDAEGHYAGDQALKSVAHALIAAAAGYPGSFVARLAGDEFCVTLEGRDLASALELGKKALEELNAETHGLRSLSCGTAWAPSGEGSASPSSLLKDADTALYIAKREGGARVCSAGVGRNSRAVERRVADLGSGASADRLVAATDALVADLDNRLAEAPALDRLEEIAEVFTQVGDFASWFISVLAPGTDKLADLSTGDNRELHAEPVRLTSGASKSYPLADFPATERIIRAGYGSLLVSRDDACSDPAERELLKGLGFELVLGAAARAHGKVYLVELFGDGRTPSPGSLATLLRLSVQAGARDEPSVACELPDDRP